MTRESDALRAGIRNIRRAVASGGTRVPARSAPARAEDPGQGGAPMEALEARVAHLEQLVQGLQDSVHRASERQEGRISELERQIQPSALAAALSKDARERGL